LNPRTRIRSPVAGHLRRVREGISEYEIGRSTSQYVYGGVGALASPLASARRRWCQSRARAAPRSCLAEPEFGGERPGQSQVGPPLVGRVRAW